ncbi:hypothetical protein [Solihabitans fulvus]|uniref:hypothetical protein n=1 Tax=Solihabitans fulvus TaxID=1892852 RepID=UPI001661F6DD|nr:hypothetical protein [Solihabitans fulvus]
MEWTPDAIKAEVDYRQKALLRDAAAHRLHASRQGGTWWSKLRDRSSAARNGHGDII